MPVLCTIIKTIFAEKKKFLIELFMKPSGMVLNNYLYISIEFLDTNELLINKTKYIKTVLDYQYLRNKNPV